MLYKTTTQIHSLSLLNMAIHPHTFNCVSRERLVSSCQVSTLRGKQPTVTTLCANSKGKHGEGEKANSTKHDHIHDLSFHQGVLPCELGCPRCFVIFFNKKADQKKCYSRKLGLCRGATERSATVMRGIQHKSTTPFVKHYFRNCCTI